MLTDHFAFHSTSELIVEYFPVTIQIEYEQSQKPYRKPPDKSNVLNPITFASNIIGRLTSSCVRGTAMEAARGRSNQHEHTS